MIKIKKFSKLSLDELYSIMALRSEIFVVEQNCIYNDVDGKDKSSMHMWIEEKGRIVAYMRVVDKGISYDEASIGRVVVAREARGRGLAKKIILEGITYITEKLGEKKITIGAQEYLTEFYRKLGFVDISDVYEEDGIPHLDMQFSNH